MMPKNYLLSLKIRDVIMELESAIKHWIFDNNDVSYLISRVFNKGITKFFDNKGLSNIGVLDGRAYLYAMFKDLINVEHLNDIIDCKVLRNKLNKQDCEYDVGQVNAQIEKGKNVITHIYAKRSKLELVKIINDGYSKNVGAEFIKESEKLIIKPLTEKKKFVIPDLDDVILFEFHGLKKPKKYLKVVPYKPNGLQVIGNAAFPGDTSHWGKPVYKNTLFTNLSFYSIHKFGVGKINSRSMVTRAYDPENKVFTVGKLEEDLQKLQIK